MGSLVVSKSAEKAAPRFSSVSPRLAPCSAWIARSFCPRVRANEPPYVCAGYGEKRRRRLYDLADLAAWRD